MRQDSDKVEKLKLRNFVQVFSLDVVAGALAMAYMANRSSGIDLHPVFWPVLAMAVWAIYTADHLVDSLGGNRSDLALRHKIHFIYRNPLAMLSIVSAVGATILALVFLDSKIVFTGLILSGISGLYFLLLALKVDHKSKWFIREVFVAGIYTLGVWLIPLSHGQFMLWKSLILMIVVFLTVFANLIMNGIFESDEDRSADFSSFATTWGKPISRLIFWLSLLLAMGLSGFVALHFMPHLLMASFLIMLIIQVVLLVIMKNEERFAVKKRYRTLSDLLYILPIIIIFMP